MDFTGRAGGYYDPLLLKIVGIIIFLLIGILGVYLLYDKNSYD